MRTIKRWVLLGLAAVMILPWLLGVAARSLQEASQSFYRLLWTLLPGLLLVVALLCLLVFLVYRRRAR